MQTLSREKKSNQYNRFLKGLLEICACFTDARVEYRFGGSFALCLYAGSYVLDCADLDFVCKTRTMHDRAVAALIAKLGYTVQKKEEWQNDDGQNNINTVLHSPTNLEVGVACVHDITLTEKSNTLCVQNQHISIFTLHDLQTIYRAFSDRKPGGREKLKIIDGLIIPKQSLLPSRRAVNKW